MRRITMKKANELMQSDEIFTKKFTPKYLIENGIVTEDDYRWLICIIASDEDADEPMLFYHNVFNSAFYMKTCHFLETKHCKGFVFTVPRTLCNTPFFVALEDFRDAQLFPLIHNEDPD